MDACSDEGLVNFFLKCSRVELAHIDALSIRSKSASREETLRKAVCAFGKKFGVDIPEGPCLPREPYVATASTPGKRYRQIQRARKSVGLVVPRERSQTWLERIMNASTERTIASMTHRAICEFSPIEA